MSHNRAAFLPGITVAFINYYSLVLISFSFLFCYGGKRRRRRRKREEEGKKRLTATLSDLGTSC